MSNYAFRDWLTISQAAEWLSDMSGRPFSQEDIWRGIRKDYLQAYYYPQGSEQLGLYTDIQSPLNEYYNPNLRNPVTSAELFCMFVGPVPFYSYEEFRMGIKSKLPHPLGIKVIDEDNCIYACFRVGDDDQPLSLDAVDYHILINMEDLEACLATLPKHVKSPRKHVHISASQTNVTQEKPPADDPYAFLSELPTLALSTAPRAGMFDPDIDIEEPENEASTKEVPALKALGILAHLVADLSEKLDQHEQVPSKQLGLKKAGRPIVRSIAEQMSATAKQLNFEGHGSGASGFAGNLGKALKQLQ